MSERRFGPYGCAEDFVVATAYPVPARHTPVETGCWNPGDARPPGKRLIDNPLARPTPFGRSRW